MDENFYHGKLKDAVLCKALIKSVTPADCRYLSGEISKTTGKCVSETTLKRLFGFADVKHHFSLFTLTALSEYAGFESWSQFCKKTGDQAAMPGNDSWAEFGTRASKITDFTLKTIRNRSGIPYPLTTGRKFAETDLAFFRSSEMCFASLVAPPGYGKSILLCRLIEKFFRGDEALHKDDVVWCIPTGALQEISSGISTLQEWLSVKSGFDYRISFSDYFNKYPAERKGKVWIVIDGFDDVLVKKDQVERLFDKIVDFICENEDNNWLKIVLSMRSTSWLSFYNRVQNSAYLRSVWYQGSHFRHDEVSNVPPLTDLEIAGILRRIDNNFSDLQKISNNLKKQFRFPYYLQLYYQIRQDGEYSDSQQYVTFYELISDFVRQKIYVSANSADKVFLIQRLIQLTFYGRQGSQIYKEQLKLDNHGLKKAYQELLMNGILAEEKPCDQSLHLGVIRFAHQHIFEYFLSLGLIEKYGETIHPRLLEHIIAEYANNPVKVQILQWVIRYAVIHYQLEALNDILRLPLLPIEKSYLLVFMGEVLTAKVRHQPELADDLQKHGVHQAFLNELAPCLKRMERLQGNHDLQFPILNITNFT